MITTYFHPQAEFEETTFNNYYRSDEEVTAPLKDEGSPVYKAGLRLVQSKTKLIPCPYHTAWMKAGKGKQITGKVM